MRRSTAGFVIAGLLLSTSGSAGTLLEGKSKSLSGLAACHAIGDGVQRANCYDREYATLRTAVDNGDLVIVDREGVRQTRQSLFGFSLPALAIFGDSGNDKKKAAERGELQEISTTLRSARPDQEGRWLMVLDNGSSWRQMSDDVLGHSPRPGDPVVIHRAALGSFIMRVGKQPGFKVRREG